MRLLPPIRSAKRQIYVSALVDFTCRCLAPGLLLKRQMAPLDEASEVMRRMTEGETPFATVPVTRDDEIGRCSSTSTAWWRNEGALKTKSASVNLPSRAGALPTAPMTEHG